MDPAAFASLAEVRFQIRRFLHFSECVAREHGLEPQQHQALLAISSLPPHRKPDHPRDRFALVHRAQQRHWAYRAPGETGAVKRMKGEEDRREVL